MKIAKLFDISDEQVAESAPEFKALPHRLEFIAEHNGIKWFNDSKATTPEASIAALQAFEEPIILIAGGYDKNLPFQTLAKVIIDKCKAVILLGQTADKIKKDVESFASKKNSPVVEICDTLKQAVNAANQKASPSDVILLSPACTSYDMFDNYQTRGKQFKTLVFDIAR
jgi:UDP-N-acetylmuramoylalanine--D-glutamate ligase